MSLKERASLKVRYFIFFIILRWKKERENDSLIIKLSIKFLEKESNIALMRKNYHFSYETTWSCHTLRHLFSTILTDACLITVNTMTQLLHASTDFFFASLWSKQLAAKKTFENAVIIYKELSFIKSIMTMSIRESIHLEFLYF